MKQILSFALALLPCLAWAQYPSNGNQKITLGEQTTADGLFYRGLAADTTRKPSIDTMAYMLLDTATNIMWHYKKQTNNAWLRLNLLPTDTASMLTPYIERGDTASMLTNYWRSGRFAGTLPVANGGTNLTSFTAANRIPFASSSTALTTSSSFTYNSSSSTITINNGSGSATLSLEGNGSYVRMGTGGSSILAYEGNIIYYGSGNLLDYSVFNTGGGEKMRLNTAGELGIGYGTTDNGAYKLQVKDSVYVGGNVSASAYTTRSDFNLKDDIFDLKYGLNDVLQLQPVEYTYKSNGSKQLGFIAQDIGTILPEVVSFEESMSVNYQAIIPILTKAIQEQQAIIKALEQRIINLENK